MGSPPTIPGSAKKGTMTWMHSDSTRAEFRAQLDSVADAVRELVRSAPQEILEEDFGMDNFVAKREWLAEVNACWHSLLKGHSEIREEHGSE